MTTLADIESHLGDTTIETMAQGLSSSSDDYAVENFIAKIIFAVNAYENTLVNPANGAKTNASWGVNGSGIVTFSIKGLCNFTGGSPKIGEPV